MSMRERLGRPVSSRGFLQLAVGTVAVLGLVVTSGAFVRLTGSGLGCDNWRKSEVTARCVPLERHGGEIPSRHERCSDAHEHAHARTSRGKGRSWCQSL